MSLPRFRLVLASLAALGWLSGVGYGQTTVTPAPRAEEIASTTRSALAAVRELPVAAGPRSMPRVEGTPVPGLRLTLDGSGSTGGRVWYRWIQTQGSRVAIANADKVEASVVVPEDATVLGFVLVVGNSSGVDARGISVEVEHLDRSLDVAELRADAGADLTSGVGRRVALDGKASEPRGHVRFRWMQIEGPPATIQATSGTTCSFVPDKPGDYRFALLVIGPTNLVSEPALVTVHAVGSQSGSKTQAVNPVLPLDEFARRAVASIRGGPRSALDLAEAMEAVADRSEAFKTYLDAASELTSRINAVVPADPERRDDWINVFFKPWTVRMAESMKQTGIDLSQPDGQGKMLSKMQRSRLADQFRLTAAGLRATSLRR